jgi:hypothetical protein
MENPVELSFKKWLARQKLVLERAGQQDGLYDFIEPFLIEAYKLGYSAGEQAHNNDYDDGYQEGYDAAEYEHACEGTEGERRL